MKKRILIFAAVLAVAASMAGCGNKADNKGSGVVGDGKTATQTAAPADGSTAAPKTAEQVKEELDNFAKDADKNADTKKIEGNELSGDGNAKNDFSGYETEIKKAVKTQDKDGNPVLVVEFSFKNRTSVITKFASVINVTAMQGERELPVALTYEAEGYEPMTIAQDVDTNQTITVQKAYKIVSGDPITITARRSDATGGNDSISKTFNMQ